MNKNKEFLIEGSDYEFDLSKFVGKKIKTVTGYPSAPFDSTTPVFKISKIIFEDGSELWVEGEHDVPYIPADDKVKELSYDRLMEFIDNEDDECHCEGEECTCNATH